MKTVENNLVNIEYERPKFWKRIFANLLDFILLAFLTVAFFIPTRAIVTNSDGYKKLEDTITTHQLECGLFKQTSDGKIYNLVDFFANTTDVYSASEKAEFYEEKIAYFINYMANTVSEENSKSILKEYNDYRLSDSRKFDGKNYFILEGDEVVKNIDAGIFDDKYNQNIYEPYISNYLVGHLNKDIEAVNEAYKAESRFLLFLEAPVALMLAALLVYVIPPFIFKRNRSTVGKMLYKIGCVGPDCLAVSNKKLIIKSLLFIFLEVLGSLFLLGIPLIITFTMMLVTKKQQGFADYMTGISEIDLNSAQIYYSKEEALVSAMNTNKKAPNFKSKF